MIAVFPKAALGVLLGYLLGSFLPAYFLARWLEGVDLRRVGTGNVGVSNLRAQLGRWWPVIPAAVYDAGKGLAAVVVAGWIGVPEPLSYLAGTGAILGHVFPFYLGFRGGQGAATAAGLAFWAVASLWVGLPPPWSCPICPPSRG